MNKLILLATFLAVAVSVSYAMPSMEDNDNEMQALFQEIASSQNDAQAITQGFLSKAKKIICKIANNRIVKFLCKRRKWQELVIQSEDLEAKEQFSKKTICNIISCVKKFC